jgi:hypothetical protein
MMISNPPLPIYCQEQAILTHAIYAVSANPKNRFRLLGVTFNGSSLADALYFDTDWLQ